jgi:hypothetical protein
MNFFSVATSIAAENNTCHHVSNKIDVGTYLPVRSMYILKLKYYYEKVDPGYCEAAAAARCQTTSS